MTAYRGDHAYSHSWDILIRARISTDILLGDKKKGVSTSRNKARRQRYIPLSIQGEWKIRTLPVHTNTLWSRGKTIHIWSHLKASLRPEEVGETDQTLRDKTYVDNLMNTGERLQEMVRFKSRATQILQ